VSIRLSFHLSVPADKPLLADLLLWARLSGDIDRSSGGL